jgi:hypothetical protein
MMTMHGLTIVIIVMIGEAKECISQLDFVLLFSCCHFLTNGNYRLSRIIIASNDIKKKRKWKSIEDDFFSRINN